MKNLSKEIAAEIYRKKYWKVIRGDEITNQTISESIYDSAVNMGCSQAIKLCQRAASLPETGRMDDITLKFLNNK